MTAPPGSWTRFATFVVDRGARGSTTGGTAAVYDVDVYDDPDRGYSGAEPEWIAVPDCEIGLARWRLGGRRSVVDAQPTTTAQLELAFTGKVGGRWSWRSQLGVGDEIRLRVLIGADETILWRGDVRSMRDRWRPDVAKVVTVIDATDILARFAAVDLPERPPIGAGDTTDERLVRIADIAGVPVERLTLDPSPVALVGTNLAQNLAGEINRTVASDGGDVYADRAGQLRFRAVNWWLTDPRAAEVQLEWTNNPDLPGRCLGGELVTGVNVDQVVNEVTLSRGDVGVATVRDTASQSLYGLRTWSRRDLLTLDTGHIGNLAAWRLAELANRTRDIDDLDPGPITNASLAVDVAGIQLGDQHLVHIDDGETVTDLPVWVDGVEHTVIRHRWTCRLTVNNRHEWAADVTGYDSPHPGDGYDQALYSGIAA